MGTHSFLTGIDAIMMNIRFFLIFDMRKCHGVRVGGCEDCFCRLWEPVDVKTFILCYAQRIAAGMEIDMNEKLDECSVFVGHCTCHCNCKEIS